MGTGLGTLITAGCSQCGKANIDYVKGGEFLNHISNHQLLKEKKERYVDILINREKKHADMDTQAERYRGTHTCQQLRTYALVVILVRERANQRITNYTYDIHMRFKRILTTAKQ
jgi:hypothetical protein